MLATRIRAVNERVLPFALILADGHRLVTGEWQVAIESGGRRHARGQGVWRP